MEFFGKHRITFAAAALAFGVTGVTVLANRNTPEEPQKPVVEAPSKPSPEESSENPHKAVHAIVREKLQAWNRQWQTESQPESQAPRDDDSMPEDLPIPHEVNKRIITALKAKIDCGIEGSKADLACRDEFESLEDGCRGCRPGTLDECSPEPKARCLAAERAMVECWDLGRETGDACLRDFQNKHEEESNALKIHEQAKLARFLNDVENDRELDPYFSELIFLKQLQEALGENYTVEKYYEFISTLEDIGYSIDDFRSILEKYANAYENREGLFLKPLGFRHDAITNRYMIDDFPVHLEILRMTSGKPQTGF